MRRYQQPRRSGIQQGLDFGMQLQQLAAPFINRQYQLKDQELRRQQQLEDIDRARNNQLEDLQRQFQLKQAMGEIGGIRTTPITPAQGDRPASIGALPVSANDPKDLMVASPGVFISPSENLAALKAKSQREALLDRLSKPAQPTISNGIMNKPIFDEQGNIIGYEASDIPFRSIPSKVQTTMGSEIVPESIQEDGIGASGQNLSGASLPTPTQTETPQQSLREIMNQDYLAKAKARSTASQERPVTGNERLKIIKDFTDLSGLSSKDILKSLNDGKTTLEEMAATIGELGGARNIPQAQVKSLIAWKAMTRDFDRVENLLNEIESEVGPLSGRTNEFLLKYPILKTDPRVGELFAQINELAADQIHEKYGGALSSGETARAEKWALSTDLPFETIKARLKAAKLGIQSEQEAFKEVMQGMRIRAPGITDAIGGPQHGIGNRSGGGLKLPSGKTYSVE